MTITVPQLRLCSELVWVIWSDNRIRPRCIEGNMEEIGEWTTLLLTEEPVPLGVDVHIRCDKTHLGGIVASCTFDDPLGYLVRVRLNADSRWSEAWFAPKHLLSPESPKGAAARM